MESDIRIPSYWPVAAAVLKAASPLQKLVDQRPAVTHISCTRQALEILHNDGFAKYARTLEPFYSDLARGAVWADQGWKNTTHYFNPVTWKGVWHFPHALCTFLAWSRKAETNWRRGRRRQAMFFLGAAAHLVQDMCVPHHASSTVFDGHRAFETWATDHATDYLVKDGGEYRVQFPADWIIANALVAGRFRAIMGPEQNEAGYSWAAAALLPRAQRTTAGYLAEFCRSVGIKQNIEVRS